MTILLEIFVVAAVVFGVVGWGLGGVGGLRPAPPDSGDLGLPPGRLGPGAIDRTRFGLAFRGYRMVEVDRVLDRLRDEVAERELELAVLRGDVPPPTPVDAADPDEPTGTDEG